MPDTVLLTNTNTNAILVASENYLLGEGVTHYSTVFTPNLLVAGTGDNDIFVNGSLIQLGTYRTIYIDNPAASGISIVVGETGSIFGSSNYPTIDSEADRTTILNNGMITGGEPIELNGENSRVINTGTIQSNFTTNAFGAHSIRFLGASAVLNNSGLINGIGGVFVTAGIDLTNSGTISSINAAIYITGTQLSTVVNSGVISASNGDAILGNNAVQNVTNTGEIFGDINLIDDNDSVRNTGAVLGNVDLGSGDDVYLGNGDSTVSGKIYGGQGDDRLIGGDNEDVMYGDDEADKMRGRDGDDRLYGGDGEDDIHGQNGDDFISGGNGKDLLRGGRGNDNISGGSGNDKIIGGRGEDILTGGAGRDVFVFNRRSGDDEITDFVNDIDRLDLSSYGLTSALDLTNAGAIIANGTGSIIDLTLIGGDGVIYVDDMSVGQWNGADFIF